MLIWCCTGFMTKINADTHSIIYTFLDFIESALPLFFNFYLFQVEDAEFSVQTFAVTFCMRVTFHTRAMHLLHGVGASAKMRAF